MSGKSNKKSGFGGLDDEWSCKWWKWYEFGECEE